jgi:hypothetical protein
MEKAETNASWELKKLKDKKNVKNHPENVEMVASNVKMEFVLKEHTTVN